MDSEERAKFAEDVVRGLAADPPSIPCKYLYDDRGSALFEAICETEDYYVTRADLALHRAHLDEIAARIGPHAHIIEFGSGAGIKTRNLLAAVPRPRAYTAIEISGEALADATERLQASFPGLEIRPLQADYTRPIPARSLVLQPPATRRVVYFPGSTISNFTHDEAHRFLGRIASIAGPGGGALIGVDLVKPRERLVRAYDDADGVTARFNRNLLDRLADELDAVLEADAFEHRAVYNEEFQRIEMHLVARRNTRIRLDGHAFEFAAGQSIHTENSHKYTIDGFHRLVEGTGLHPVETWTDPDEMFSMHYLEHDEKGDAAGSGESAA